VLTLDQMVCHTGLSNNLIFTDMCSGLIKSILCMRSNFNFINILIRGHKNLHDHFWYTICNLDVLFSIIYYILVNLLLSLSNLCSHMSFNLSGILYSFTTKDSHQVGDLHFRLWLAYQSKLYHLLFLLLLLTPTLFTKLPTFLIIKKSKLTTNKRLCYNKKETELFMFGDK